jgi:hypothetical protein
MGSDLGSCCMGLVSVVVATTVWGVANQLLYGWEFFETSITTGWEIGIGNFRTLLSLVHCRLETW